MASKKTKTVTFHPDTDVEHWTQELYTLCTILSQREQKALSLRRLARLIGWKISYTRPLLDGLVNQGKLVSPSKDHYAAPGVVAQ